MKQDPVSMSYQEMPWMCEGQNEPWPTSIEAEGCAPLPDDWTHRHDIILRDAAENGTDFGRVRFILKKRPPLRTLQNRWFSLLYDPEVSRQFCEATNSHVRAPQKKVAWSEFEETILLEKIEHPQSIISFDKLLEKHRGDFHPQRNAKQLEAHYQKLRSSAMQVDHTAPRQIPVAPAQPPTTTLPALPPHNVPSFPDTTFGQLRKLFACNSLIDQFEARRQLVSALEARPHLHGNSANASLVWGIVITESKRWVLEKLQMTVGSGDQGVDVDLSELAPRSPHKVVIERRGESVFVRNIGPLPVTVDAAPLPRGADSAIRSTCCLDMCGVILLVELIPFPVPMSLNEASHILAAIC